jgi:hypothetical protein
MSPHFVATRDAVHHLAHRVREKLHSVAPGPSNAQGPTTLRRVPSYQSKSRSGTQQLHVHYHDHIIPLPPVPLPRTLSMSSTNNFTSMPTRFSTAPAPAPMPVPRMSPLLAPGAAVARVDLSAPRLELEQLPHASTTTSTSPPVAFIRVFSPHLPGDQMLVLHAPPDMEMPGSSLLFAQPLTPATVLNALHLLLHTTPIHTCDLMSATPSKRARVTGRAWTRGSGKVALIDWLEGLTVFAGLSREPGLVGGVLRDGMQLDENTWVLLLEPS